MRMSAARLETIGLTAGYGATRVVDDVSLDVPPGGKLAVLGRNGVGKTTLFKTLMGLTQRHSGRILLDGAVVSNFKPFARARGGLGYVPQTRDVFPSLSVEENLFVGLKGRPRSAIEEAYKLFPRLEERRLSMGTQLSGGEQQMLSIARAILGRPSVLLMDEPLEGLAPIICDELMMALECLTADRSTTVLLIEQQIERALAFSDQALILERGRITWSGAASELRTKGKVVEALLGLHTLRRQ
jgi:branched-chain amino acid transport system ATP-binding protein